jgi:predicted P-loop ATPase
VLEGRQGMYKSSALRVLGGPWFKDTDLDLQNKDAMTALQGAWLYEIAEMDSLTRAEASKQKSFLSRQVDEFRPVYGRREVRLPRQVVFAGTTNSWEWNKDPTGGRRFWPVEVTDVDLQALTGQRDQLFAEALVEYRAGAACFPTREQQRDLFDPEQLKRQQSEGYVDALHDWVYSRTADFSMAEAVADGLRMDYSKLTRDVQTRVGNALKALGCTRVERRNGTVRFWYRPPTRKAASSEFTPAQQTSGAGHEPLPI